MVPSEKDGGTIIQKLKDWRVKTMLIAIDHHNPENGTFPPAIELVSIDSAFMSFIPKDRYEYIQKMWVYVNGITSHECPYMKIIGNVVFNEDDLKKYAEKGRADDDVIKYMKEYGLPINDIYADDTIASLAAYLEMYDNHNVRYITGSYW